MRGGSTVVHALVQARRGALVEVVHRSPHCRDVDLGTRISDVDLNGERDSINNGAGAIGVSRSSGGRGLGG